MSQKEKKQGFGMFWQKEELRLCGPGRELRWVKQTLLLVGQWPKKPFLSILLALLTSPLIPEIFRELRSTPYSAGNHQLPYELITSNDGNTTSGTVVVWQAGKDFPVVMPTTFPALVLKPLGS